MDFNEMHSLPEWEDHRQLIQMYEGEEWKARTQLDAAKELYNKWREIFVLVESYCETLQDSEEYDHAERNKELIWQHIFIVAPKIIGAASVTDYVHKMENASIVRYNCRELMEQIQFTAIVGAGEQKYADTIEREMQDFKVLFRKWVSTFEHDGYEDEWGLFT